MDRLSFIYGLADPLSGTIRYIGKSVNPKGRYTSHLSRIKEKPRTHKEFWILSLQQLGLKPELIILETTTELQASEREIFWIAEYRSLGFNLTNLSDGGDGPLGYKHTEEWKKNNSELMKGNKYRLGIKQPQEAINKVTKINIGNKYCLGKKHTEETKAKMSISHLGNINGKFLKGYKQTDEAKNNSSKAKLGKKHTSEQRHNMSIAHIGYVMPKEQKDKISASRKAAWARRKMAVS